METIYFYRANEVPYGVFSNFDKRHPITIHGKIWPSTEHYFQAQKFVDTEFEEQVRLTKTPAQSAEMGRRRDLPLRKDWEDVKDEIMRDAIVVKFTQYPELLELLLSTDDAILIEHTENDHYWADGGDGSGKNMLGIILMEFRSKMKELKTLKEELKVAFTDLDKFTDKYVHFMENKESLFEEHMNKVREEFKDKIK